MKLKLLNKIAVDGEIEDFTLGLSYCNVVKEKNIAIVEKPTTSCPRKYVDLASPSKILAAKFGVLNKIA